MVRQPDNTLGNKGALIHLVGVVRSVPMACVRVKILTRPEWRLAPRRENCIFPATACAVYPFAPL